MSIKINIKGIYLQRDTNIRIAGNPKAAEKQDSSQKHDLERRIGVTYVLISDPALTAK